MGVLVVEVANHVLERINRSWFCGWSPSRHLWDRLHARLLKKDRGAGLMLPTVALPGAFLERLADMGQGDFERALDVCKDTLEEWWDHGDESALLDAAHLLVDRIGPSTMGRATVLKTLAVSAAGATTEGVTADDFPWVSLVAGGLALAIEAGSLLFVGHQRRCWPRQIMNIGLGRVRPQESTGSVGNAPDP